MAYGPQEQGRPPPPYTPPQLSSVREHSARDYDSLPPSLCLANKLLFSFSVFVSPSVMRYTKPVIQAEGLGDSSLQG